MVFCGGEHVRKATSIMSSEVINHVCMRTIYTLGVQIHIHQNVHTPNHIYTPKYQYIYTKLCTTPKLTFSFQSQVGVLVPQQLKGTSPLQWLVLIWITPPCCVHCITHTILFGNVYAGYRAVDYHVSYVLLIIMYHRYFCWSDMRVYYIHAMCYNTGCNYV